MKIEIKIGIPPYIIDEGEIDELKNNIMGEYLDKFAHIGATEEDINIIIEPTEGDFYTRISGLEEEDTLEPASPVSSKTVEAEEPVNLKDVLTQEERVKEEVEDYDNTDITESKEKMCKDDDNISIRDYCDECCEESPCMCEEDECELDECYCAESPRELSRVGENIALLKLYLMLKNNCGMQELHTKYGATYIDYDEKAFLLHKLFESTGLDAIAKEVEKTLDK